MESPIPRNVMRAYDDSGAARALAATGEGHLEVAIHGPRLPFGEVEVESKYPEFQIDGVYGINASLTESTTSATGSVTSSNNLLIAATGTTAGATATLQSRKRLRYQPGVGALVRYTAKFDAGIADCYLLAGVGTAESGYYFGYVGTSFGILHVTGGVREIQTLTVSGGATSATNVTITLDNVAFVTAVTNAGGNATLTAYEIANRSGGYTGWIAEQRGATVVFVARAAGNKTNTFSYNAGTSGSAASFAETLAGVSSTDTFIPQSSWNGDKLDGTGPSGVTLNPQYGNVYEIGIQYLGYGGVTFKVEIAAPGNNPDFVAVHTIRIPNSQAAVSVTQPSFPFRIAAVSAGSTTNKSVSCGSAAGFRCGNLHFTGPRMSPVRETNGFVGSTAATYYPLFTVRNDLVYGGRANQAVSHILSVTGAHDDATPVGYYLIRNATLTGTPSFAAFSTSSALYWDVAAATCTISTNEQVVAAYYVGAQGTLQFQFEDDITLQPGEALTLACRAVTGTATYVAGSLNIREDT